MTSNPVASWDTTWFRGFRVNVLGDGRVRLERLDHNGFAATVVILEPRDALGIGDMLKLAALRAIAQGDES